MDIESRIAAIEARNQQVSLDKAWEVSLTRRLVICIMTYVTTLITFMIPDANWSVAAFIPVVGYYLSNLSLPWLKRTWEKHLLKSRK